MQFRGVIFLSFCALNELKISWIIGRRQCPVSRVHITSGRMKHVSLFWPTPGQAYTEKNLDSSGFSAEGTLKDFSFAGKVLVCVGYVKRTTSAENVLWLKVPLILFLIFNYKDFFLLFLELINALCAFWPRLILTLPECLWRYVTEEMHVDWNNFYHQLFWSLWSELLMTYCSVLTKKEEEKRGNPREKV